ncbi:CYCLIN-DEPENDENT KINASE E-1 [Salix viminalis]|uniref:CYCLIN-DEPENDENT KINASE E-1 n=1 Tax=Salix viminalis TaxID=40686 RepID=A0A9Q0UT89_SALVM|nr:CYCLIN-DEPENDENT KINASE E-1 [Salix viminalis]
MGLSKLLIFGLARIYQAPLKALSDNGVVVTIWYRAPELLLGAKHYTSAIDMWAIFKVLGHPTLEKWPTLASLPHWHNDVEHIQGHKYENTGLHSVVPLSAKGAPFDLLSKMLEYDPRKRITAAQALEHDYFRSEPLPGRNALVPSQPGEKVINYPTRPVDTNTDFEGTTSLQPPQPVSSGNAVSWS